jgi:hypothetical protein
MQAGQFLQKLIHTYTPFSTPIASVHEQIVRQTVAIANSNTGNFDFLSTLISKAARAGVI